VTDVTEEEGQVTVRGSVGSLGVVRLVAAIEQHPTVTESAAQTPSEQMETPPSETATLTPSTDRPIPGFTMTIAVLSLLMAFGLLRLR
jgi:hypothetical protein